MWGRMLPASIFIFLTVNKRAGLQLAAHYWGAVVTHGRVPCSALWFRVAVDARDCREKRAEQQWVRREVTLLSVGSDQNEREQPGGVESHSYWEWQDWKKTLVIWATVTETTRGFNVWYLRKILTWLKKTNWKTELWEWMTNKSPTMVYFKSYKLLRKNKSTATLDLFSLQCLTVNPSTHIHFLPER